MEFSFNVNDIIKKEITKIESNLLPEEFLGDRRSACNCSTRISEILDEMGLASARAQGLQKAITSGARMRNVDHRVYLLIDPPGNSGKGSIVGLLKMGRKKLFMFDPTGGHHEMDPLCVLDFYVHESKQRMGCGKILYEHMLSEENVRPQHLAIDRPSEKFLGFLHKHYGLSKIVPQSNHFVVYEEFFINRQEHASVPERYYSSSRSCELTSSSQPSATRNMNNGSTNQCNGQPRPFGRYAAHKPPATIGKLLQNPTLHPPQRSGGTITPPVSHGLASGDPSAPIINGKCELVYCPVESLTEQYPATSLLCEDHDDSFPVKRDLKFHHTPLW